jgi:hypothetical protein
MSSNNTRAAIASVAEAFASCGSDRSRSAADARSAGPISFEAINTANKSNASSMALLHNVRAVASNVADRRGTGKRRRVKASPVNPTRANAWTRPGGTSAMSTRAAPKLATSATRSNARTISSPDARVGARRNRSSSDTRDPDATVNNLSSRRPGSVDTRPANRVYRRSDISVRTSATSRASTLTPGNRIFSLRNHATTWSNNWLGRSGRVQARASAHQPINIGRRRNLIRDIPDNPSRHQSPIGQERPQKPDRPQLHPEPDPEVVTASHLHTPAIRVIPEEEPLQLSLDGLPVELTVNRRLLVTEETPQAHDQPSPGRPLTPDPVPLRLRPRSTVMRECAKHIHGPKLPPVQALQNRAPVQRQGY